jgi:hypothetical protein
MKSKITKIKGTDLIKIQLGKGLAHRADRVSQLAKRMLTQDQVRTDADRCSPDMRELLERGAQALTLLSETRDTPMVVEPIFLLDGHTAACLVAGRETPTNYERDDVREILGLLAGLLPLFTTGIRLPAWKDFGSKIKGLDRGKKIYEELRCQDTSVTGLRQITLRDALILRESLRLWSHPNVLKLWKDLDRITATHRHALARLMQKGAPQ